MTAGQQDLKEKIKKLKAEGTEPTKLDLATEGKRAAAERLRLVKQQTEAEEKLTKKAEQAVDKSKKCKAEKEKRLKEEESRHKAEKEAIERDFKAMEEAAEEQKQKAKEELEKQQANYQRELKRLDTHISAITPVTGELSEGGGVQSELPMLSAAAPEVQNADYITQSMFDPAGLSKYLFEDKTLVGLATKPGEEAAKLMTASTQRFLGNLLAQHKTALIMEIQQRQLLAAQQAQLEAEQKRQQEQQATENSPAGQSSPAEPMDEDTRGQKGSRDEAKVDGEPKNKAAKRAA